MVNLPNFGRLPANGGYPPSDTSARLVKSHRKSPVPSGRVCQQRPEHGELRMSAPISDMNRPTSVRRRSTPAFGGRSAGDATGHAERSAHSHPTKRTATPAPATSATRPYPTTPRTSESMLAGDRNLRRHDLLDRHWRRGWRALPAPVTAMHSVSAAATSPFVSESRTWYADSTRSRRRTSCGSCSTPTASDPKSLTTDLAPHDLAPWSRLLPPSSSGPRRCPSVV